VQRIAAIVTDTGRRALARFVELEGFDRAMALAGQAFAALLPLLLVVSAVSPTDGRDAASSLSRRFDLEGSAAAALQASVKQPAEVQSSITIIGVLVLVISALSFTRAMQRLYVRAWRLPRLGVFGNGWGLLWLACFCVYVSLQPVISGLFSGALATVVALALSTGLWLVTPWILVGKRIRWPQLLPQALLTSVSLAIFGAASVLYMPRAVATASHQFGVIGIAFALLSWLFVASLILVVTAAIGATLAERTPRPAPEAVGVTSTG
jgi:membrane protein